VAAIDDMTRQLGFGYDTPALGPPQLRLMDVGSRSLYGNAIVQHFNASSGGTIGKGSGFVGTRAMCAEESIITTQHSDRSYSLGQPQAPAEGQQGGRR
jgi:hypothetical protein